MRNSSVTKKGMIPPLGAQWSLLFCFLATNTLLSTFLLPATIAWVVGFLGLVIPAGWVMFKRRLPSPDLEGPDRHRWSAVFLLIVLGGGAWLRFHRLTSLSQWPLYDEGIYAFYSLLFDEGWQDRLFFSKSNAPALYAWAMAVGNRLWGASLTTLWLVPALFSISAVPLAFMAAQRFFSRDVAFLVVLFMSLGFFPAYVGRFSFAVVTGLFWACLTFYLMSRCLEEIREGRGWLWTIAFGASLGGGLYTDHPWPAFIAAAFLAILAAVRRGKPGGIRRLVMIGAVFLATAWPYAWGFYQGQFGIYHSRLFFLTSQAGWDHLPVAASYFQAFFWGVARDVHSYKPVWGGFLDPLSGSLVLLGMLVLTTRFHDGRVRWMGTALFLFLLPGLLSLGWMPFRAVLVPPLLAVFASFGFLSLFPDRKRGRMASVFLAVVVLSLSSWHLFVKYGGTWNDNQTWADYVKSPERRAAYRILGEWAKREGPGLVLSEWVPGQSDETLDYACYRFNAARNPRLDPAEAKWGALMANVHYRPFLAARFPEGKAYRLSEGRQDGGWMLWIVPVEERDRPTWSEWVLAHRALATFIDRNLSHVVGAPYDDVVGAFTATWDLYRRDPFTCAVFWEKAAELYWLETAYGMDGGLSPDPPGWTQGNESRVLYCLGRAVKDGYPAAHLYRRMGVEHLMKGRIHEARPYFRAATRSSLDLTDSREMLLKLVP